MGQDEYMELNADVYMAHTHTEYFSSLHTVQSNTKMKIIRWVIFKLKWKT